MLDEIIRCMRNRYGVRLYTLHTRPQRFDVGAVAGELVAAWYDEDRRVVTVPACRVQVDGIAHVVREVEYYVSGALKGAAMESRDA